MEMKKRKDTVIELAKWDTDKEYRFTIRKQISKTNKILRRKDNVW